MLKIKLTPIGKKHAIKYRVVVLPEHSKLTGSVVDLLGYWTPLENKLEVDKARVADWIAKGAQPTATVRKLLAL